MAVKDWISRTKPWTSGRQWTGLDGVRVADEPPYKYIKARPTGRVPPDSLSLRCGADAPF